MQINQVQTLVYDYAKWVQTLAPEFEEHARLTEIKRKLEVQLQVSFVALLNLDSKDANFLRDTKQIQERDMQMLQEVKKAEVFEKYLTTKVQTKLNEIIGIVNEYSGCFLGNNRVPALVLRFTSFEELTLNSQNVIKCADDFAKKQYN